MAGIDPSRAIHIGNVTEFNGQFLGPGFRADHLEGWEREGDHYACLAPFYTPSPGLVILPNLVAKDWLQLQASVLGWKDVDAAYVGGGGSISRKIQSDVDLLSRVARSNLPLVPWGLTPQFEQLVSSVAEVRSPQPSPPDDHHEVGGASLAAVRKFESKVASYELFNSIADPESKIRVPTQRVCGSVEDAARVLAQRAGRGHRSVIKSEFSVGGFGVAVVDPESIADSQDALSLVKALIDEDAIFDTGQLLIEEFVAGARQAKDLTYDGVVNPDASVTAVGIGVMLVEGTNYIGVTVGPGIVPEAENQVAAWFGDSVGEALGAAGYRGWFDVDFIADPEGCIWPTEINVRLTGPTVAYSILRNLDRGGSRHVVRTLDILRLGHPISERELLEHFGRLSDMCASMDVRLVPLITTASASIDPYPYMGVALCVESEGDKRGSGASLCALDLAEARIRAANNSLGEASA